MLYSILFVELSPCLSDNLLSQINRTLAFLPANYNKLYIPNIRVMLNIDNFKGLEKILNSTTRSPDYRLNIAAVILTLFTLLGFHFLECSSPTSFHVFLHLLKVERLLVKILFHCIQLLLF